LHGYAGFAEPCTATTALRNGAKAPYMLPHFQDAFKLFDANDDGSLDIAEVKAVLQQQAGEELSDAAIQQVIDEFDANGDGKLQLEEFQQMWQPLVDAMESGAASLDDDDLNGTTASAVTTPAVSEPENDAALDPATAPSLPMASVPRKGLVTTLMRTASRSFKTASKSFNKGAASFRKGAAASFRKGAGKAKNKKAPAIKKAADKEKRGSASLTPREQHAVSRAVTRKPSRSDADMLRTQADLREAASAEDLKQQAHEAAAASITSDTFERRLGAALVQNEHAKAARAGSKLALSELVREWDINGDGVLSKIEFRRACKNSLGLIAANEEIDRVFSAFDTDHSDSLELSELRPALRSLHDAAVAANVEAQALRSLGSECAKRAAKFIEAAETMASIEADEVACAEVERAGQSVSHKLAHAFSRRALKLDDVIHKWPGLLQVPNEQPKVSKAMFVKGVLEYRVLVHEKGVSEIEEWFDEELQSAHGATGKAQIFLRQALAASIDAFKKRTAELAQLEMDVAEKRKVAKAQQTAIAGAQAAEEEQMRRSQAAAERAAEERAAAEEATKTAKLASFKRKKEQQQKEKQEFDERVKAKRNSWTPLEEPFTKTIGAVSTRDVLSA